MARGQRGHGNGGRSAYSHGTPGAQSRAAFVAAGGFIAVYGAALSTLIESNVVTLSDLSGSVAMTIAGGQYSKNGGAYASGATTVTNGDTVKARLTSSASAGTSASVTLTINGIARTFTVTTSATAVAALNYPTMVLIGNSLEEYNGKGTGGTPRRYGLAPTGHTNWMNELGAGRLFDLKMEYGAEAYPYFDPPSIYASAGAGFDAGETASPGRRISIAAQVSLAVTYLGTLPAGKRAAIFNAGRVGIDTMTTTDWLTRFTQLLDQLVAAADLVIVVGQWKRPVAAGGVWASGGIARTNLDIVNAAFPAICAARPKTAYVPMQGMVGTGTGDDDPKPGYVYPDNTHLLPYGQKTLGAYERSLLVPSRLTPQAFPTPVTNLAPAIAGSGGTLQNSCTGVVATGYTLGKGDTAMAAAGSVTGAVQRVALTRAATQTSVVNGFQLNSANIALVVGARYRARCRYKISATAIPVAIAFYASEFAAAGGATNQRVVGHWNMQNDDVNTVATSQANAAMATFDASDEPELWLETPDIIVQATSGAPVAALYWHGSLPQGAAGTVNFDISDVQFERIS